MLYALLIYYYKILSYFVTTTFVLLIWFNFDLETEIFLY